MSSRGAKEKLRGRTFSEMQRAGGSDDSSGDENERTAAAVDSKRYYRPKAPTLATSQQQQQQQQQQQGENTKSKRMERQRQLEQQQKEQDPKLQVRRKALQHKRSSEAAATAMRSLHDEVAVEAARVGADWVEEASLEARLLTADETAAAQGGDTAREKPVQDDGKLSFWQALFTSLNYNLGLAALSFPYQVKEVGWGAPFTLVVVCIVCTKTARMLGRIMSEAPGVHSYAGIAAHSVSTYWNSDHLSSAPRLASVTLRAFQITELFFYLVYNLVTISQAVDALMGGASTSVCWLVTLAVTLPSLAILSNELVSKISIFGITSFVLLLSLLLGSSLFRLASMPDGEEPYTAWPLFPEKATIWTKSFGGILLLFAGHAVFPSIHHNLRNKEDYDRVVTWTFFFIVAATVLLGSACTVAFGDHLTPLPTGMLEAGSALNSVGQVLMILKGMTAYPVIAFPIIVELSSRFTVETAKVMIATPGVSAVTPARMLAFRNLLHVTPKHTGSGDADSDSDSGTGSDSGSTASEDDDEHVAPIVYSPFTPSALETARRSEPNRLFARRVLLIQFCTSALLLACSMAMAMVTPSLEFVMDLVGSVFAVSLAVTLPGLFFAANFGEDLGFRVPLAVTLFGLVSMGLSFSSLFTGA